MKEQFVIDDEDEFPEITAANTPMKKNKPVCIIFTMTNCYKKHIQEEHKAPFIRLCLPCEHII